MTDLTTRRAQLEQIKEDLSSAQPAIKDEMARLRAVRDVCRGVGERFGAIVGAGDERLAWLAARGEVSVDEVVCSTTIVYNQCARLSAPPRLS
jgi:ESCRT-I complex subunit TSG101